MDVDALAKTKGGKKGGMEKDNCFSGESMDEACTARWSRRIFGQDFLDAHHVYRFPEALHIIAKSLANHSQLLLESLHACNHVRIVNLRRREVSQWVARIVLVIQSSPCIEPHFRLATC